MINKEQLPGLWFVSVPEGEVLSEPGALAPGSYSGFDSKTTKTQQVGGLNALPRVSHL